MAKIYLSQDNSTVPERTELLAVPSLSARHAEKIAYFGDEFWYGFSFYLPSDYQSNEHYEILAQWMGTKNKDENGVVECSNGADRGPTLELEFCLGNFILKNKYDPSFITKLSVNDSENHHTYTDNPPIILSSSENDKGKWTDWVFHIKWSYNPEATGFEEGLIEVWKNGEKIHEQKGANAFNDEDNGKKNWSFFKCGLYKPPWKIDEETGEPAVVDLIREKTILFDEIRSAVGTNGYDIVAPGGKKKSKNIINYINAIVD